MSILTTGKNTCATSVIFITIVLGFVLADLLWNNNLSLQVYDQGNGHVSGGKEASRPSSLVNVVGIKLHKQSQPVDCLATLRGMRIQDKVSEISDDVPK